MMVLVTGATGFIGRHLCARLAAERVRVRAIYRSAPTLESPLLDWRCLKDLHDAAAWSGLLDDVHAVVHLAGMAHQMGRAGKGRRDEFWRTNVESTALIARLCAQAGIARLVFMSSIAARSSAEGGPQNDYGRSKREAESGLQRELATAVTDWCVMRPPLVYGPGNPGNMGRLLKLVDSGIPLPFASIRNTRSFMFIGNLVDAIITVLRHPGRIRDVFELGDGTELSTPALITALAKRIGRSPRLFPIPVPMLRYVARVADLFGAATGLSVPFDSYSMDRLTESLVVDWSHFRANFSWAPPVNPTDALGLVTPM